MSANKQSPPNHHEAEKSSRKISQPQLSIIKYFHISKYILNYKSKSYNINCSRREKKIEKQRKLREEGIARVSQPERERK